MRPLSKEQFARNKDLGRRTNALQRVPGPLRVSGARSREVPDELDVAAPALELAARSEAVVAAVSHQHVRENWRELTSDRCNKSP